jgi:hypothetical protein
MIEKAFRSEEGKKPPHAVTTIEIHARNNIQSRLKLLRAFVAPENADVRKNCSKKLEGAHRI